MGKSINIKSIVLIIVAAMLPSLVGRAGEPCCTVPDNLGTANLPPMGCTYQSYWEPWEITNRLPIGTTIEMDVTLKDFVCCGINCPLCSALMFPDDCETRGGTLGGHAECFDSTLQLEVRGTGSLAGFRRTLYVPVFCEIHTGPRTPGEPVQRFQAEMYRMEGELFGDPDFCTFRVRAGQSLGLPGPGETVLTKLPSGDFAVDSFFDITYEIEFEGCPDGVLAGYFGTTQMTKRISICEPERACEPTQDGSACVQTECPESWDRCQPSCANFDPRTGEVTITECDCRAANDCHLDISEVGSGSYCVLPDNDTGTADLPPIGCEYTSPDEKFMIIDGLPVNTTIEMEGTHKDFICCEDICQLCSVPIPPGECETRGGILGGNVQCFESTLYLKASGTGDLSWFNRNLAVPVFCEVHTGPRTPGEPEQSFPADMSRLHGELFGDPDFCTFRIIGGTDFGLPGPGQTTLTQLPSGDFAVDSFFDITYQIEFEGCPGSPLQKLQGTTTATIRMETGGDPVFPSCVGSCADGGTCEKKQVTNTDGTVDICCDCEYESVVCEPTADGSGCKDADCNDPNLTCLPKVVRHNVPRQFFPAPGVDMIGPIGGSMDIQDPGGAVRTVNILSEVLPNNMVIHRGTALDAGDHWIVPTEMVALELTGDDGTAIRLNEAQSSIGQMIGSSYPDTDFPAESFFDVFTEIDLPGLFGTSLHNASPIRLQSPGIDGIPPLGAVFETPGDWPGVELLAPAGEKTGYLVVNVVLTMPPARPEWEVLECECMEEDPGHTFTDDDDCSDCADLNCDGVVNFKDFAIMALQWLTSCSD